MRPHQGLVELAGCRSDLSVHLHRLVVQGSWLRCSIGLGSRRRSRCLRRAGLHAEVMSIKAFAARHHRPQNARVLVGQRCRHRSHNGVAPTAVRKRPMSSAAPAPYQGRRCDGCIHRNACLCGVALLACGCQPTRAMARLSITSRRQLQARPVDREDNFRGASCAYSCRSLPMVGVGKSVHCYEW